MTQDDQFEIFLVAAPGLEAELCAEAKSKQFGKARVVDGGVAIKGGWREVWRANLQLRGADRIFARIASFRARFLSELDKQGRGVAWSEILRRDVPVRVEATCSRSEIYHSGAAAERVERAIFAVAGAPIADDAPVTIKVRIESDLCTITVDTSGEPLHKRGHKQAVAKAPMRETLAALFLRQCGFTGAEPVLDPMCGSGTFVIEAAEIAAGLQPGRSRRFAFEKLATFDAEEWLRLKGLRPPIVPAVRFYGRDRDAGAIRMSRANAERAEVSEFADFETMDVRELVRPPGPAGLVIVNPPFGTRIGEAAGLETLYRSLGQVLSRQFAGWRVGLITSELQLAKATGLPFKPPLRPVGHGGLTVRLHTTDALP